MREGEERGRERGEGGRERGGEGRETERGRERGIHILALHM